MKIPPGFKATLIVLAAGLFVADSPTAKEKAPAAATPTTENQAPPLLLANVWNPSIDPTGWWMSEKYDGLRAWWDGQKLWSRKGNLIHAPDYFLAEFPRDIVLDGELWIAHGKFEETMSIVRSETPDDRWNRVSYMVFDAPQVRGTFEQRMQFLRENALEGNCFVRIVAQERCQGVTQLLAERDRVVRQGAEGLMLRQPESVYEAGRSPTLLRCGSDRHRARTGERKIRGQARGALRPGGRRQGILRRERPDRRRSKIAATGGDGHHLSVPGINRQRVAEVPFLFARARGLNAPG